MTATPYSRILGAALVLLGTLTCMSCAAPAQSVNMIPERYDVATRHPAPVTVRVTGGKGTSAFGVPQLGNDEFRLALEAAITESRVFHPIRPDAAGTYVIEVLLISLESSMFFNVQMSLATQWKLVDVRTQAIVWKEIIVTDHTATGGDTLIGVTRVRMAIEGAAKKNIQQGIAELSRVAAVRD